MQNTYIIQELVAWSVTTYKMSYLSTLGASMLHLILSILTASPVSPNTPNPNNPTILKRFTESEFSNEFHVEIIVIVNDC